MANVTPANKEAERMAIACALTYSEVLDDFVMLTEDDFSSPNLRRMYKAIIKDYAERGEVDMVALAEKLRTPVVELVSIANEAFTPGLFMQTVEVLKENSRRRMLLRLADYFQRKAGDVNENTRKIVMEAADLIESASVSGDQLPVQLDRVIRKRLAAYSNDEQQLGIQTGLVDLDRKWAGLINSELTIVAGRPSMGKTQLMLHLADIATEQTQLPSLFVSIEMPKDQIADRYISRIIELDTDSMRRGYGSKHKFDNAQIPDHHCKIYVLDQSEMTTFQVQSHARKLKRKEGLGAVFVDFLTLLGDERERGQNEHQHVSSMTRKLRSIAETLEVPMIVAAQLSRSVEQRENKRPRLSDLRESGGIEEVAANVLLLYREEYYNPDTHRRNELDIGIAKQKQGPRGGIATIGYNAGLGQFYSIARAGEGWQCINGEEF